jgi:hypothetical protein
LNKAIKRFFKGGIFNDCSLGNSKTAYLPSEQSFTTQRRALSAEKMPRVSIFPINLSAFVTCTFIEQQAKAQQAVLLQL